MNQHKPTFPSKYQVMLIKLAAFYPNPNKKLNRQLYNTRIYDYTKIKQI